jgi:chemotaxis methyl-accepting protein methylase
MPIAERTAAPAAGSPITQREFEEIQQLAYRTFGLDLKTGKEQMVVARLRRLVNGGNFRTFHDYYRMFFRTPPGGRWQR